MKIELFKSGIRINSKYKVFKSLFRFSFFLPFYFYIGIDKDYSTREFKFGLLIEKLHGHYFGRLFLPYLEIYELFIWNKQKIK